MRRPATLLAAGLLLAGCGAGTTTSTDADVTLLLGGPPTAVDAGIYLAVERGFDEAEGVDVTIRRSGDPVRLLQTARVGAAIMTVAQAREANARCVMAFRQPPEPGPYLCVPATEITDDPATVAALVRALQRGYAEADVDPESAVQAIVTRAPATDYAATLEDLNALSSSFTSGAPFYGWLNRDAIAPADRSLFAFSVARPFSRE